MVYARRDFYAILICKDVKQSIGKGEVFARHEICDFGILLRYEKEELLWERKVENDMERALKNQEYKVYLQPKYSLGNEKLAAAEALVRWVHPEDGLIAKCQWMTLTQDILR